MDYYASKRVALHCERLLQPYTVQQAVLQPYTVQEAVPQPSTEQEAVLQPYTVQQAMLRPSTIQQAVLQPYTVQQAVLQPSTVQQAVLQPYTVPEAVLQPSTAQQAVLRPSTIQQAVFQPSTVQQAVLQPYTIQQAVVQPYTVQQAVVQPSTVQQAVLQRDVLQQNTGVAHSPSTATHYGWVNRLLSDEQIQQFITSTVLPHHRALTSPDQSKKTAKYLAPTAAPVSQRGVETGLQTTPITPAKFMEAGSSSKRFPPSYVTVRSGQQSSKTPRAEDRIAALAGVNSFLSDEQIKQFITSTVLPHHHALTNPQSKISTNAKQHKHDMINVGESSKRPVEQVPTQSKISPRGTKRGAVSGFQDTWGENCISNGLNSQGSTTVLVPSVHSTVTSSMDPVQYTMLKAARTNSMETQSLMATSMPANGTFAYGVSTNRASANTVSTNDVPAHQVSDNAVSANHVLTNGVSAKGVSTNGVSAKNVSANDESASQQHQHSPIPQTQSLSLVSHTKAKRLRKKAAKTKQKDKQTSVDISSDLGSSPPSHLSRHVQTESTEQDSSEGLPDCKKNKRKIPAVKNREKSCRKSPKKRGKELKSSGTPKKRRKVVSSESTGAEVQKCPESQESTDSDREISPDDDDFFNESVQEFFDILMHWEVPPNAQPSILPLYFPSKNIIPCENYYIDLDLFL